MRSALVLPRRLSHTRDLLTDLVSRDFRARYTDSMLGVVWAILHPLAQLGVYYFVFQQVLDLGIRRYSSFVFIGLIAWAWFASTINASVRALKSNRDVVEQPGFPAPILPVVSVATSMVDFLIALPIVGAIVVLEEGFASLGLALLALPAVMVVQFVFTLGLALLVAGANAALQDLQHVILMVLQLYFFLTPIFYDLDSVPEQYRGLFEMNPMMHIVEGYRSVLMHGGAPEWVPLLYVLLGSLLMVVLGAYVYEWARFRFLEDL